MRLESIMSTDVQTIGLDETVDRATQIMSDKHVGSLVVLKDSQVVGILTRETWQ